MAIWTPSMQFLQPGQKNPFNALEKFYSNSENDKVYITFSKVLRKLLSTRRVRLW